MMWVSSEITCKSLSNSFASNTPLRKGEYSCRNAVLPAQERGNTAALLDWSREVWQYLAVALDMFLRCVVGWAMTEHMHTR